MKIASKICTFLLLCGVIFGAGVDNEPADVSIIRLIAAPKDFSKKVVRVVGYLTIGFEGDAIYLHEEDFRRSLTTNALSIEAEPSVMKRLRKLSNQYVIVEGVFDASSGGHMNLFSGGIRNVTRADAWKPGPAATAPPK